MQTIQNPFGRGNMPSAFLGTKQAVGTGEALSNMILGTMKSTTNMANIVVDKQKEERILNDREKKKQKEERILRERKKKEERILNDREKREERILNDREKKEQKEERILRERKKREERILRERKKKEQKENEFLTIDSLSSDLKEQQASIEYQSLTENEQIEFLMKQDEDFNLHQFNNELSIIKQREISNSLNIGIQKLTKSVVQKSQDGILTQKLGTLNSSDNLDAMETFRGIYNSMEYGKKMSKDQLYDAMQKTILTKLEDPKYKSMSRDEIDKLFPAMREIENDLFTSKYKKKVDDIVTTGIKKANNDYMDSVFKSAEEDSAQPNIKKLIKENKSNTTIDGATKKKIGSYLGSMTGKVGTSKEDLTASTNSFKSMTTFSSLNTPKQTKENLSFFTNGSASIQRTALEKDIHTNYAGNPDVIKSKVLDLNRQYEKGLYTAIEVSKHKAGDPILSNYGQVKDMIKTDMKSLFFKSMYNKDSNGDSSVDYKGLVGSTVSLNKLPEEFVSSFDSIIRSKDKDGLVSALAIVNGISKDSKALSIVSKNPMIKSMMDVVNNVSTDNTNRIESIMERANFLLTDDGKTEFAEKKKDILFNLRKDRRWFNKSAKERSVIVDKLTYDNIFNLSSGKDIVNKAYDTSKSVTQTVNNTNIVDANSFYPPEAMDAITELVRGTMLTKEDSILDLSVDDNGGFEVREGDSIVFISNSKEDTQQMMDVLAFIKREKEKGGSGIALTIGSGIALSATTLWDKSSVGESFIELTDKGLMGYTKHGVADISSWWVDEVKRINKSSKDVREGN